MAGNSLEPIKLFYGNQESMKLLYETTARQVWTSYRFSQSNSTLKRDKGTKPRKLQGSLASGIRAATQTHQVAGCREWLQVQYLAACSPFSKAAFTGLCLEATSE